MEKLSKETLNKINLILSNLSKSNFRSKFHLKENDRQYILDKGIATIRKHAYDLIAKRLAPKEIKNDGKQTPMKGHPVFIAQHATATCCRGCLFNWHHIEKNKELSKEEIDFIVNLIMAWIVKDFNRKSNKN